MATLRLLLLLLLPVYGIAANELPGNGQTVENQQQCTREFTLAYKSWLKRYLFDNQGNSDKERFEKETALLGKLNEVLHNYANKNCFNERDQSKINILEKATAKYKATINRLVKEGKKLEADEYMQRYGKPRDQFHKKAAHTFTHLAMYTGVTLR